MIETFIKVAPPGPSVEGHGQAVIPVHGVRGEFPVVEEGVLY